MKLLQTLFTILAITGATVICCEQTKEGAATKEAVEDVTGMTTIKQGTAMKKKLKAIEKDAEKREKELDEIQ